MNVENSLSGRVAVVDHGAVSVGVQMQIARDLSDAHQRRSDGGGVGLAQIIEAGNVLARNDQHMRGCLRVDVMERDDIAVFIDFLRGDLAVRNAAEETTVSGGHARII